MKLEVFESISGNRIGLDLKSQSLLESILHGLIILLVAIYLVIFLLFSYRLLVYPYDWNPSESDHIYYTSRLLNGDTLYKDNNSFPFLSVCYPPLYYLILAPAVKLLGPTMFSGRIMAVMLATILVCLLYKIIRSQTGSRLTASVVALSLLAYGPISVWIPLIRIDIPYVIFALFGAYLVSMHNRGHRYIILASACFACSFFTKQVGLFAFGAGFLYLMLSKEVKKSIELLLVFLLLTVPLNLLLNHLTNGWYLHQLFGLNMHKEFLWWRKSFLLNFLWTIPVFLAAASYEIFEQIREKKVSIWQLYLLASISVALLIFFDGTGENYFLPLFTAVLILAGTGISRFLQEGLQWRAFIYLLIIFQLITFGSSTTFLKGPKSKDRVELDTVAKIINNSNSPVLVDRMSSLILGTKHLEYFVEPVPLMELYLSRQWNPDILVATIAERKFSLIVLFDKTQFVPPVLAAIDRFYVPFASFPVKTVEPRVSYNLILYKPK